MLWIKIHNNGKGTEKIGHYDITIGINSEVLWEGQLRNFPRESGYKELIKELAKML